MNHDQIILYMKEKSSNPAISTIVGLVLILFLAVALTGIIYVILSGLVFPVEKTAYVATEIGYLEDVSGVDVVYVRHLNGDEMFYETLNPDAEYEVRFVVDAGGESEVVRVLPGLLYDPLFAPGDQVLFFRRPEGYYLTNNLSLISGAIRFPTGDIGIRVIDKTHDQLIGLLAAPTGSGGNITPTLTPTSIPTTLPTPSQSCSNCDEGEGFIVAFTKEVRGPLTIRFQDASIPQPNIRAWTFGDGSSDIGQTIDHTYSAPGAYLITLTVEKNKSDCTCTLYQWITVN